MESSWQSARYLISALTDSRNRTLALISDLNAQQLTVPLLPIINPIIWEVGHVGWFQEKWVLRHLRGDAPLIENADALWDSAAVPHDSRWTLPLLSIDDTLAFLRRLHERVVDRLESGTLTDDEAYFCWLAIMHEDMHGEALTYTRQTLGYPPPPLRVESPTTPASPPKGDVEFSGGEYMLGARPARRFVFDNEKWQHPVDVKPFAIGRSSVTEGQFAEFVDDDGYRRRELWTDQGWEWRERADARHPVYWIRNGHAWCVRRFDHTEPLNPDTALIHVNWHEADAYCRWAGRRLPLEAEWEFAAAGTDKREFPWGNEPPGPDRAQLDSRGLGCIPVGALASGDTPQGVRQMIGNVWEWTAEDFQPYPGFVRDPYKEYSEPWFGPPYKVLRGGCWATRSRLVRNTWRNFYTKDRRDVFAGFRTCALT
ncbi:MAG TPA: selenoneine synthase SenA [Bryobacteraceae bacterium]|jgi:iron(II)-dependent oxidoreductase